MVRTSQWNRPKKVGAGTSKGTALTSRKGHPLTRWLLTALGIIVLGTIAAYNFLGQEETVEPSVVEKGKKHRRIRKAKPTKVAKYSAKKKSESPVRRKKATQIIDDVQPDDNVVVLSEEDDVEPLLFGVAGSYRYCVIDLSGGANARSYPVTCYRNEPDGGFNTEEYKTTKLVLKRVGPGSFIMGEDQTDVSHRVTFAKPFYMGLFEVTQMQWELVMGTNPCSATEYGRGDANPVHYVSYNMIRGSSLGAKWPKSNAVDEDSFLGRLREKTNIEFDLPTEAQWEYTCRAGTTTKFSYGNVANGAYMWYSGNNSSRETGKYSTKVVGTKLPNDWGFYDMHGNVYEWCLDWDDKDESGAYKALGYGENPKGLSSGRWRVIRSVRGWDYGPGCTSSVRGGNLPSSGHYYTGGFRLCLPPRFECDEVDEEEEYETATTSTDGVWIDDFDEAKRLAAKERKLILVDFSGSDWCGWCMKLDAEVFSTEEFMAKASDNFILLMIDSPRDKTRLSEKAAMQNPGLVRQYVIRGYPTVLILNSYGDVLYETSGYRAGGPTAYLKHLEDALRNR